MRSVHRPVLLRELLEALHIQPNDIVVDATVGGAGHSAAVAERLGECGTLICLDRDADALERSKERLANIAPAVHFAEASFHELDRVLADLGIEKVDTIVMDLGMSSDQLERSGRGFSLRRNEPLLMTFKKEPSEGDMTAREIVNVWSEEHLADILHGFGEERFSRRIAREIVAARQETPIESTRQLVAIVNRAVPAWYRFRKRHAATKTFQAIRMAANRELDVLREGLDKNVDLLVPDGRLAVITFHSVEDRVVKTFFNDSVRTGRGSVITKKPIVPGSHEIAGNPRARSAKLRIFESR